MSDYPAQDFVAKRTVEPVPRHLHHYGLVIVPSQGHTRPNLGSYIRQLFMCSNSKARNIIHGHKLGGQWHQIGILTHQVGEENLGIKHLDSGKWHHNLRYDIQLPDTGHSYSDGLQPSQYADPCNGLVENPNTACKCSKSYLDRMSMLSGVFDELLNVLPGIEVALTNQTQHKLYPGVPAKQAKAFSFYIKSTCLSATFTGPRHQLDVVGGFTAGPNVHITEIYDNVHHLGHTVLLQEVLLCLLRAADSHHDVDTTASNIGGHYQTTPHHHGLSPGKLPTRSKQVKVLSGFANNDDAYLIMRTTSPSLRLSNMTETNRKVFSMDAWQTIAGCLQKHQPTDNVHHGPLHLQPLLSEIAVADQMSGGVAACSYRTSLTAPKDCNQQNCGSNSQVLHHFLAICQVAVELHHHAVSPQQYPLHYQPRTADSVCEEYKIKEIPILEKVPTLGGNVEKEDDSRSARVDDHNHTNTQNFVLIRSWTTFTGTTYKDPARRRDGACPKVTTVMVNFHIAGWITFSCFRLIHEAQPAQTLPLNKLFTMTTCYLLLYSHSTITMLRISLHLVTNQVKLTGISYCVSTQEKYQHHPHVSTNPCPVDQKRWDCCGEDINPDSHAINHLRHHITALLVTQVAGPRHALPASSCCGHLQHLLDQELLLEMS